MHQLQRIGLLGITILLLAGFWAGLWYQGQRKGARIFSAEAAGLAEGGASGGGREKETETGAGAGQQQIGSGGMQREEETTYGGGGEGEQDWRELAGVQPNRAMLAIHVVGRVASPGLYYLPAGSRIYDAVMEAEPEEDADLGRINLAVLIEDGMQIRVPIIGKPSAWDGEALVVKAGDNKGQTQDMSGGSAQPGKININTATARELESLPGIGPVYSQRIVQYREKNGSFRSIEDLTKVQGIGSAKMKDLRDLVSIS